MNFYFQGYDTLLSWTFLQHLGCLHHVTVFVQDFGSLDWGFEFNSDNYVEGSELSWRPWESSFWAQKGLFGVLGVQGKSSNRLLELSSLL